MGAARPCIILYHTVPQCTALYRTVLQLKALGIDNVMRFEFLSPPPAETMVRALEALHALGVLDDDAKWVRYTHATLHALCARIACCST